MVKLILNLGSQCFKDRMLFNSILTNTIITGKITCVLCFTQSQALCKNDQQYYQTNQSEYLKSYGLQSSFPATYKVDSVCI